MVMKYRASADEEEEAELKFAAQGVPGSGAGLNRTSWSPDARFLACGLFLGGWHGEGCVLFFFCSVMGHLFFPPPRTLPCTHTLRQRESERERERERERENKFGLPLPCTHLVSTCATPLLNRLFLSAFHPLPYTPLR